MTPYVPIRSTPFTPTGRENYDRINFHRAPKTDPAEELKQYVGNPRCQDCGWKLGTDITEYCSCGPNRDDAKHTKAFNHARELQAVVMASKTDPVHALTPGTIRDYRSDCCGVEVIGRGVCSKCHRKCSATLTKTN